MRVLLVSANFRPAVGGIDRFTEVLANGLAASGHDVRVLCCRKDGAPLHEVAASVQIDRIRSTYLLHRLMYLPYPVPEPLSATRAIRRAVRDVDVVHVQDALYLTSVAVLVAARRRGIPSVLTQHVAFVPQENRLLDTAQRGAIRTLGRCVGLATAVTTVNPAVAEWVDATWRVPARWLPVGVEPPSSNDARSVRASFGLPEERFLALFVGRNVPKKGLDHFLAGGSPSYDLVAVTDRPSDGDDRARFLPFMEHARLQQLLGAVDAFVLPSTGEGFPVVIQEALSLGVPVVTTSGPGYDGYLAEDDVVFVDADGSSIRAALERLAADEGHRAALSARARAVAAREFGVSRFVRSYEQLYEELRDRRGLQP